MSGGIAAQIVLVVAASEDGVIGAGNALPWKISSDMRRFKALTMGKPMIMGRKTFDSIGKALPGRDNIVVTRNKTFAADGIIAVSSFDEALETARERAAARNADEIAVIGGADIFALALPLADRIAMTVVHGPVEGDARFPMIDPDAWREVSRQTVVRSETDSHDTSFVIHERRGGETGG